MSMAMGGWSHCQDRLTANEDHGAIRLQGDSRHAIVRGLLGSNGGSNERVQISVRRPVANGITKANTILAKEAGSQAAVGIESNSVASAAKLVRHR